MFAHSLRKTGLVLRGMARNDKQKDKQNDKKHDIQNDKQKKNKMARKTE